MTGHDELKADDAIIDISAVPPERLLKGVQADLKWALAELECKAKRARGKAAFKKTDVARAAEAMRKAGVKGRIELPGGITMLLDGDGQHEPEPNPWEES